MVPLISALLSALLIYAVVQIQGAPLSKIGVVHKSSVERDDHNILPSAYNTGRQLHPPHEKHDHDSVHPHPPHPPSHHNNKDSKYTGCLGLSDEELASFPDAPPCTISVNGIVVAGHSSSSTTENGSSISESDTSGSESDGSSESNSSSGINNDSSTSEFNYTKGNGVEGEDDSDGSSGGYYSYEVDESNKGDDSEINVGSGIDGDDSNETSSNSENGGDDSNETNSNSGSDTDANETSSNGTDDSTNDDDKDDDGMPSPLMYFNISDCETYANMWVWDLAMTCSDSSMNQTDCQCTSAEILMQYGELYCPSAKDPVCPDNCSVCHTCMEFLGCSSPDDAQDGQYLPPEQVLLGDGMSSTILPLALGIAAAILGLVGSSYYQYTHRNSDTGAFPSLELEPPSNASML